MQIIKNIKEDFSLDEIVTLQSLLGQIKQSKEDELRGSETLFKFSEDYLKMVKHTFSEKYEAPKISVNANSYFWMLNDVLPGFRHFSIPMNIIKN